MAWGTSLCFATGGLGDIVSCLGAGFGNIFGGTLFLVIFALIVTFLISWRLKLSADLTAVFLLGTVFALTLGYAEDWIKWILIIILAIVTGYGVYKFMRR